MSVSGPRVVLRRPGPEDRDAFLRAMRSSASLHRPWLYPPCSTADFVTYLERIAGDRFEGFLARRRDDDAIVGLVNLSEIVRGALQSCFVGYGGVAGHTGQGYMTEALDLAVGHAFTSLGLHRVEANIQPANAASLAVAGRVGFEREGFSPRYLRIGGQWRDHERWALREEGWRDRPR